MIVQNSRIQMKYSTIPGVVPTIPLSDDHTDGTWLPTDLYVGEIFLNSADNLAWWRSQTGLIPFGATGGTSVFIGDFVNKSTGGTYGGPVFGPEFNADIIYGDEVQGVTGSFSGPVSASTYYGDGSNLTGIVATWNGGVVGNTAQFQSDVTFDTTIYVDNIDSIGSELQINAPIVTNAGATFNGNVQAVSFIGDGSQLTGITGGTDTYTVAATLVGNTIQFDRNDTTNAYSVDLSSIASAPVVSIGWDNTLNEFTLELADGTIFQLPITQFTDLIVTGSVTADYFIGDGSQLTNLPVTTGPTGETGATGPQGPTGAAGSTPYMVISYASTGFTLATGTVTLPVTTTLYIGWNTGTRLRLWHDATHYMEGVITSSMTYPQVAGNDITVLIDFVVGTGTPGSWLVGIAGDQGGNAGATTILTDTVGNITDTIEIDINVNNFGTGVQSIDTSTNEYSRSNWTPYSYISTVESGPLLSQYQQNASQYIFDVQDSANIFNITLSPTNSIISDTLGKGLQYQNDYSSTFNLYSLVDKNYVDTVASSLNLTQVLLNGNDSGANSIIMDNNQSIIHGSTTDFGLRFTTDPVSTDIKWTYIHGDSNGGYSRVGVDNTTAEDFGIARMQTRNADNTGADIFMTQGDNNITLNTNDGTDFTIFDITPGFIIVNNPSLTNLRPGIEYDDDYSANFTARTLVDKGYVDTVAGGLTLGQVLLNGNNTNNTDIELNNNSFTSGSDAIRAVGNTYDDAGFTFEDLGAGAWAPIIRTWEGDFKNHILVTGSETQLFNSRVGGIYNHYSNFVQDWNSMSFNVADGTSGNGISMDIGTNTFDLYSSSPTFAGIKYGADWSANFTARSLVDKAYVDGLVGAVPTLQSVLSAGNTSGNQNIVFNNNYGLENSTGEADIKLTEYQIDAIHQKFTNATDYKRGLFQGNGHNGTASITGDDYNVTSDLYRGSSLDVTNIYAKLFYQETQISTGNGYQTYAQINKDNILINSSYNSTVANSNFAGLQYNHDYSANFTTRSLVDKAYVDNAVGGGSFIPPISPMEIFRGRSFRFDSTTADTYGGINTLNNASAIAVAPSSTNFGNKFSRLRYYASIVSTGRVTSIRSTDLQWFIHGGFRFVSTWRVADTAYGSTCQNFHGLIGTTSEIAVGGAGLIQVSTLTNCIFVGNDGADANLQVMHNDATGTCTKIDLGANFPANRTAGAAMTTMYAVEIYNGVRETSVKYRVTNLETGDIAEGTITTNLPATTQGLAIQSARVMGTPTTNTGQWEQHKWGCSDITA